MAIRIRCHTSFENIDATWTFAHHANWFDPHPHHPPTPCVTKLLYVLFIDFNHLKHFHQHKMAALCSAIVWLVHVGRKWSVRHYFCVKPEQPNGHETKPEIIRTPPQTWRWELSWNKFYCRIVALDTVDDFFFISSDSPFYGLGLYFRVDYPVSSKIWINFFKNCQNLTFLSLIKACLNWNIHLYHWKCKECIWFMSTVLSAPSFDVYLWGGSLHHLWAILCIF